MMTVAASHPSQKQQDARPLAAWAEAGFAGAAAGWMDKYRADSQKAFLAGGFPATQNDSWRHMGLDAILKSDWTRVADVSRVETPAGAALETASWAQLKQLPEAALRQRLANPFARLNAALLERGTHVRVPQNVCCLQPLRIVPAPKAVSGQPWMIHPRFSITLEHGSRLDVVLDCASLPALPGFMNLVMDIALQEQTALNLVLCGPEASGVLSLLDVSVAQRRDSVFRVFCFETRAQQNRVDLAVSLDGENASTDLFGLALLGGESRAFHHLNVDHRVPHTQSQQVFKSVLSGSARFEYDSLVTIRPEAPHASSEQLNKNLVLSDGARAYARPQLAIHTDEVQCHHGATVGQMSAEELLYLRTRGIAPASASELILRGFVDDLLKEIPVPAVSAELQKRAHERLEEIVR